MKAFLIKSGILKLKLNNGALVRAMTIVVATYIGIAANNKIPNTNPAKPCKCACVSCHQRKREKMSKLNMNFIIVHVTKK